MNEKMTNLFSQADKSDDHPHRDQAKPNIEEGGHPTF